MSKLYLYIQRDIMDFITISRLYGNGYYVGFESENKNKIEIDKISDVWSPLMTCCNLALQGPLRWRDNGRDGVSNDQPHDCLRNSLFGRRSKKTSKFRLTGFCAGIHWGPVNSPHKWPVTRKMFPFDDVIMPRRHFQGGWNSIKSQKNITRQLQLNLFHINIQYKPAQ